MSIPMKARREAPTALLEAASTLLERAGGSLLTTPLIKALFYLDLHALLETGKTVTGANYVALKAGPVVENYPEQLINGLERNRIALQEDDNPDYKPVVLLHPAKRKFLNEDQLALAEQVAAWAKKQSATELSLYSHQNPGWVVAWKDGEGQGGRIDLRVAMQQLLDDDPWIHEEMATEAEKEAFTSPDGEEFVEW